MSGAERAARGAAPDDGTESETGDTARVERAPGGADQGFQHAGSQGAEKHRRPSMQPGAATGAGSLPERIKQKTQGAQARLADAGPSALPGDVPDVLPGNVPSRGPGDLPDVDPTRIPGERPPTPMGEPFDPARPGIGDDPDVTPIDQPGDDPDYMPGMPSGGSGGLTM